MNLTTNHIPESWNPDDKTAFNKWINKVYNHVKKTK